MKDRGTRSNEIGEMGGRRKVEHEANRARGREDKTISKNGKLTPGIAEWSKMDRE